MSMSLLHFCLFILSSSFLSLSLSTYYLLTTVNCLVFLLGIPSHNYNHTPIVPNSKTVIVIVDQWICLFDSCVHIWLVCSTFSRLCVCSVLFCAIANINVSVYYPFINFTTGCFIITTTTTIVIFTLKHTIQISVYYYSYYYIIVVQCCLPAIYYSIIYPSIHMFYSMFIWNIIN